MDPALVNTKILPRLPIESIVALAATMRYDGDRSDDMWKERITKMGYPPVDIFPQGFYFSINGNPNPALQFRSVISNKVDAHARAFLDHYSKLSQWGGDKRKMIESLLSKEFCHKLTPSDVTPYTRQVIRDAVFLPHIDDYHESIAAGIDHREAKEQLNDSFFDPLTGKNSAYLGCGLIDDIKAELVSISTILLTYDDIPYSDSDILIALLRYHNYPNYVAWVDNISAILRSGDVWKDPNAGWRQYDAEILSNDRCLEVDEHTLHILVEGGFERYPSYLYLLTRQSTSVEVCASLEYHAAKIKEALPPLRLLLEDAIACDNTGNVAAALERLGIKL